MTEKEIKHAMKNKNHIIHTDSKTGLKKEYECIWSFETIFLESENRFVFFLALMSFGAFAMVRTFPADECEILQNRGAKMDDDGDDE